MKNYPLAGAVFLASILGAVAQVSVEMVLDQEQFLLNESLPVKVRIINRSGQTLQLGLENDWLRFTIESTDGSFVPPLGEVPVLGAQSIESSMVGSRRIDLMPYFDLVKPGRYTVTAVVKIKSWGGEELVTKPKPFELTRGTKIWEQAFGVPVAGGGIPEARKFALQQANYLKRLTLYVRVTDLPEQKVFKVIAAGPLVSFSRPEAQIDRASNLHLLFQTGARSFLYEVINPEGEIELRQTHEYSRTRPVLRNSEEGRTEVLGGVRRVTAEDIPSPLAHVSTNDVQSLKP